MFEVGFTEIILILGLALLVLGPEKLPGLAAKVGRWTGRARTMARQLRTQLEQEVTLEEMAKTRAQSNADNPQASTAESGTPPYTAAHSDLDAQVSHDHVETAAAAPEAATHDAASPVEPAIDVPESATAKSPQ